jgi:hypothetical protein
MVSYQYGTKHYDGAYEHNRYGDCTYFEQGNPAYETVNEDMAAEISTAKTLLGAGQNETLKGAIESTLSKMGLLSVFNRQLNSSNHKIRKMVAAYDSESTVDAVARFVAAFDPGSHWYFSMAALELTEAIGAPPPEPGRGWLKILEEVASAVKKENDK